MFPENFQNVPMLTFRFVCHNFPLVIVARIYWFPAFATLKPAFPANMRSRPRLYFSVYAPHFCNPHCWKEKGRENAPALNRQKSDYFLSDFLPVASSAIAGLEAPNAGS